MKLITIFIILPFLSFAQLQPLPTLKSVEVYEFNTIVDADQSVGITEADIAGSSFTIPSAGDWLVTYYIYGALSTANSSAAIAIYNTSNVQVSGSTSNLFTSGGATSGQYFTTCSKKVTTTGATTYKLRGVTTNGLLTVRSGSVLSSLGGSSKIIIQKI